VDESDHRTSTPEQARELPPGARHYRAYVGNPASYDTTSVAQFTLMTALGLREGHTLLDIGCGSLCGGRLFIPYLLADRYFGIEPEVWLIEDGITHEVGRDLQRMKRPVFRHVSDFSAAAFGVPFDFVLAQSILTHVSRTQLERCLEQVSQSLAPEGLFAASFYDDGETMYEGDAWVYPKFASYSVGYVAEKARQYGLVAFPLIWTNSYDHYWMVFAREGQAERVSWLGAAAGHPRMVRMLELTRQLNDANREHGMTRRRLEDAELELAALRQDKPEL